MHTGNTLEINWFLSQPQRVQCSFKLIYAGLWEAIRKCSEKEAKAKHLAGLKSVLGSLAHYTIKVPRHGMVLSITKSAAKLFMLLGKHLQYLRPWSLSRLLLSNPLQGPSRPPASHALPEHIYVMSLTTLPAPKCPTTPSELQEVAYDLGGLDHGCDHLAKAADSECWSPNPAYIPTPAPSPPCSAPAYLSNLSPQRSCRFLANM